jgi:hypothetical protein
LCIGNELKLKERVMELEAQLANYQQEVLMFAAKQQEPKLSILTSTEAGTTCRQFMGGNTQLNCKR